MGMGVKCAVISDVEIASVLSAVTHTVVLLGNAQGAVTGVVTVTAMETEAVEAVATIVIPTTIVDVTVTAAGNEAVHPNHGHVAGIDAVVTVSENALEGM